MFQLIQEEKLYSILYIHMPINYVCIQVLTFDYSYGLQNSCFSKEMFELLYLFCVHFLKPNTLEVWEFQASFASRAKEKKKKKKEFYILFRSSF